MDFSKILGWKLLSGSHEFPGPSGGTCITEAAIVAEGFEYREIGGCEDAPPCFSQPITALAIELNDTMPDDDRQRLLMPFVMRMAGTADTKRVEKRRLNYIVTQVAKRIATGSRVDGECFIQSDAMRSGLSRARNIQDVGRAASGHFPYEHYASYLQDAVAEAREFGTAHETIKSLNVFFRPHNCEIGVAILDEAIRLGRQAPEKDYLKVAERFEVAKAKALEEA